MDETLCSASDKHWKCSFISFLICSMPVNTAFSTASAIVEESKEATSLTILSWEGSVAGLTAVSWSHYYA